MRKFEFVYVPASGASCRLTDLLLRNREILTQRGLTATIEQCPGLIKAEYAEEDCPSETGWINAPVNAFMDNRLLMGMRVSHVSVTYDNARIPRSSKNEMMTTGEIWCNGEFRVAPPIAPGVHIFPIVTCLPSKKIVTISLDVGDRYNWNIHRLAILGAQDWVELVIRQTRAAKQLIQAFRTAPANEGFVNRSIKELFAAIGQF